MAASAVKSLPCIIINNYCPKGYGLVGMAQTKDGKQRYKLVSLIDL